MKLLVIGSGGREHAMAWRLAKTPGMQTVYVAPGNAGTAREHELENINITDPEALADFAEQNKVHLTVVGPEAPLAAGVVNVFRACGLKIFGPTREASRRLMVQGHGSIHKHEFVRSQHRMHQLRPAVRMIGRFPGGTLDRLRTNL